MFTVPLARILPPNAIAPVLEPLVAMLLITGIPPLLNVTLSNPTVTFWLLVKSDGPIHNCLLFVLLRPNKKSIPPESVNPFDVNSCPDNLSLERICVEPPISNCALGLLVPIPTLLLIITPVVPVRSGINDNEYPIDKLSAYKAALYVPNVGFWKYPEYEYVKSPFVILDGPA